MPCGMFHWYTRLFHSRACRNMTSGGDDNGMTLEDLVQMAIGTSHPLRRGRDHSTNCLGQTESFGYAKQAQASCTMPLYVHVFTCSKGTTLHNKCGTSLSRY